MASAGGGFVRPGSIHVGMTDLSDLVDAFKREAAVPGTFDSVFPSMSDDHIIGVLMDGFSEAQLHGFFGRMELDVDMETVTPDLSTAGAALVVMYSGIRLLRQQLLGYVATSGASYKAGPVEYQEGSTSAGALTQALKDLELRRREIVANANRPVPTVTFVLDGYVPKGGAGHNFYGGMFDYETSRPTLVLGS